MKRAGIFIVALIFLITCLKAQPRVISGPMLGPVELRSAKIWLEVSPDVKTVSILYYKAGDNRTKKSVNYKGALGLDFNPIVFDVGGLDFNTLYEYTISINDKSNVKSGKFITKDLWQWRKDPPEFSFLTGSCAYVNQPEFDRPGIPYGLDSSLFETMAKEKAAFMLWLGDAWYTREVDYYSEWGLWYRASHDRSPPVLQNFLKAMPQLGIWDDHDYGPNDIGKNYILKETSRKVFNSYFPNPSAGENGQGIYTMLSWSDADIFMTDDRWWRSPDGIKDSLDGNPNPAKKMLGEQQMEWLKNSLLYSQATFKIIAVGSQVLNPVSSFDKWKDFSYEYQEMMDFLKDNNITGVIFLTGDRHHSEIIKVNRRGSYPLFDITVSPLTSGTHSFSSDEKNNPHRVLGIEGKQNYARFSFSGKKGDRRLTVKFIGLKGTLLDEWSISEKELKKP